ncbi:DUF892 family protein [Caldovatus aquaticus]|uniref:Ferritin-like domain-containing protein n=1 Tax=Caldovatus aquaticus TaxID=2865671 RepID=A0ABS7F5D3_9PROT|nr:DUF892 family protein [Caldovatus aquaticus]MBW8269980.1 ferritin-like domain-containing protein [Caldovatus aquaticus]
MASTVNAHALENRAAQLLSRQVERLENCPERERRLRKHSGKSRRRMARLDEILRARGSAPSALWVAGLSLMGDLAAMTHAVSQDAVRKNAFADHAFAHCEIASYRALLVLAEAAGDMPATAALRESPAEAERTAQRRADRPDPPTRSDPRRATPGRTPRV